MSGIVEARHPHQRGDTGADRRLGDVADGLQRIERMLRVDEDEVVAAGFGDADDLAGPRQAQHHSQCQLARLHAFERPVVDMRLVHFRLPSIAAALANQYTLYDKLTISRGGLRCRPASRPTNSRWPASAAPSARRRRRSSARSRRRNSTSSFDVRHDREGASADPRKRLRAGYDGDHREATGGIAEAAPGATNGASASTRSISPAPSGKASMWRSPPAPTPARCPSTRSC